MIHTQSLHLSQDLIIRRDPQYFDSFTAFNFVNCKTYHLDHNQYRVLKLIEKRSTSEKDLFSSLGKGSKERGRGEEIISEFLKEGILLEKIFEKTKYNTTEDNLGKKQVRFIPNSKVPVASFPTRADIFLTHRCNMKCIHCNVSAGKPLKNEIDVDDWKNIFDQLEEEKIFKIQISGGESTIYPGFSELITYLGDKKFKTSVLTNANRLDDEIIELFAKSRISVGVSLDGATPDTHDPFRKSKGSFQRVLNNLRKFQDLGIQSTITTVIHKKNQHQIQQIFDICQEYGVKMLCFVFIDEVGRGVSAQDWMLSVEEKIKAREYFHEIYPKYKELFYATIVQPENYISTIKNSQQSVFCKAGTYSMAIDSDGTVFPCTMGVQLGAIPIGNATIKPLVEIWESKNWDLFRGEIPLNQLSACSNCSLNMNCSMKKCRMRSLLNGDIQGRPSGCPSAEMKEIEQAIFDKDCFN